jgi:hypothetical protein
MVIFLSTYSMLYARAIFSAEPHASFFPEHVIRPESYNKLRAWVFKPYVEYLYFSGKKQFPRSFFTH